MIQFEYLNDNTLIKHWSDKYFMLLQEETGNEYSDPIDINPCPYTYTEIEGKFIYEPWESHEDGYHIGECVMHNSFAWESAIDNNLDIPGESESWIKK